MNKEEAFHVASYMINRKRSELIRMYNKPFKIGDGELTLEEALQINNPKNYELNGFIKKPNVIIRLFKNISAYFRKNKRIFDRRLNRAYVIKGTS